MQRENSRQVGWVRARTPSKTAGQETGPTLRFSFSACLCSSIWIVLLRAVIICKFRGNIFGVEPLAGNVSEVG